MKKGLAFLVANLSLIGWIAVAQSMSPPSQLGKEQVFKMASSLTNGMPERDANRLLEDKGLKCGYIVSDSRKETRTYHYVFTNGMLRVLVRPKLQIGTNEWNDYFRTNGFVSAADINGIQLSLTNRP